MIGQTISHYRITEKLGEGGMGVVYKAQDTKLRRTVALKFLPAGELGGEEEKARFLREAQAAASLNHPNICTIYEIDESEGSAFIAMECVEGQTLKDRIATRPQPLDTVLDLAIQAAEGLQEAHQKGVVHRDIKPANLMVNEKGQVKIMDFGLARPGDGTKLTKTGSTLGTIAYMPPEQAQGEPVDRRADIWSLGVVIYEMVTGQLPFAGDYDQVVAYNILNEDPEPLTSLRAGVPMELEWIVGKALAKDPSERYQYVEDLLVDLGALKKKMASGQSTILPSGSSHAHAAELPGQARRTRLQQWGFVAALALAIGVIVAQWLRVPTQEPPLTRFAFTVARYVWFPAVSPDGRRLAYLTSDEPQTQGQRTIWVQDLDKDEPRELEGTAGARSLFWSPDSSFVGFVAGEELKKVSGDGGPVTNLCQLPSSDFAGGTWSQNGDTIVFIAGKRFYEVPARGGTPKVLTGPTEAGEGREASHPHFVPLDDGGHALLYTLGDGPERHIAIRHPETDLEEVLHEGRRPVYSPTGHIVFEGGPNYHDLWALPFSLTQRKPVGEAFPVAQNAIYPSAAAGTLVYLGRDRGGRWRLHWRGRDGGKHGAIGKPYENIQHVALSPDQTRVAINGWTEGNQDLWVHDVGTGIATRLTFDRYRDIGPVWSPSGEELVFTSQPEGNNDIYLKSADGAGEATPLIATDWSEYACDWSADGRYILFERNRPESQTGSDIWYLRRKADSAEFEPLPFLTMASNERAAKFSPDGRYVTYVSDESGERQVYVRPFPQGAGQWQLSFNGGVQPQWRGDGTELFYVSGNAVMAVEVKTKPVFSLGQTRRLLESGGFRTTWSSPRYDVSADRQRIVVREPVVAGVQSTIRIVQNWYEEFRDREQD
jgi:Tol biopolymer transport system component